MRLLILFFSGTGNTHYVAEYLAQKLGQIPIDVLVRSIEQTPAETLPDFDLLTIGFPVYVADSPPFFQEYIHRLSDGEGRGVFVFSTKGAFAGRAGPRNLQRVASRGYVPLGEVSVTMPGTDGLAFVAKKSWMARMAENKDFEHLKSVDRLARRMEEVLQITLAGQTARNRQVRMPRNASPSLTDRLWKAVYERFTAPFKRRFYADERCNRCWLCVQICPSHNIRLEDGQIRFADRCYLCMRCVHQCPQEAIQIGKSTVGKFRWRGPKGDFRPLRLYDLRGESPFSSLPALGK
ncbi:MAG: EFR1 family ferrodoxin [Chloroflexota bacterium]|nr:EFR1 family ferrodoxin [Chloroflexota bacterium]